LIFQLYGRHRQLSPAEGGVEQNKTPGFPQVGKSGVLFVTLPDEAETTGDEEYCHEIEMS